MNETEIWEVLQTCHLASDGRDLDYLIKEGFNPTLAKIGVKLCSYLKSKEIEVQQ